jgi:hydroxymethylpyrimidine kinase/phosphomethylpyrimidine kinase/thiamine-phosphate diphosphorylase
MAVVLTIAGSDPTGGAGVQADQRVLEALGCDVVCVISAITSQSTHCVTSVFSVPSDAFASQIDTLLSDVRPAAVKIGLLPTAEHVRIVAKAIGRYDLPNVVLDPVLAPTSGVAFAAPAVIEAIRAELVPVVSLITPNISEASKLTGVAIDRMSDMNTAGVLLWEGGVKNALIKGGHLWEIGGERPIDLFVDSLSDTMWLESRYVDTPHTHGTGCFLSSAIAAGLANGMDLPYAVERAKRLLEDSLDRPRIVGKGRGSPGAPDAIRSRALEREHAERVSRLRGIYFVTDDRIGSAKAVRASVLAALAGGVKIVQLRDKSLRTPELTDLARQLREDTNDHGALLIINDYAGIAFAVDADGVHLGPSDISPDQARHILGPGKLIGISANSKKEISAYGPEWSIAASYIGCGPVFATKTKADAGSAIGVNRLTAMRDIAGKLPVVAIGGITASNLRRVREAGAAAAAVVGAIASAHDPERAARELVGIWRESEE